MEVHQLTVGMRRGDAITDAAFLFRKYFHEAGYQSEIFAEFYGDEIASECSYLGKLPSVDAPDKVLMVHYSTASVGMVTTPYFKSKKILVYHNITPYEYWVDINPMGAFHCLRGRTDLKEMVPYLHCAIGLSDFSIGDLSRWGFKNVIKLPLPFSMERLEGKSRTRILNRLMTSKARNVLVVGRVVPNKKIEDAIRICSLLENVHLIVAGSYETAVPYYHALMKEARSRRVKCDFLGHLPQEELNDLYRIADVLLICSEHEGFCVPILEGFHFGVPVVARAAGAVPETADGGALLYSEEDDLYTVATMLSRVLSDAALRSELVESGRQALQRHMAFPYREKYLQIVREVAASDPIPPKE